MKIQCSGTLERAKHSIGGAPHSHCPRCRTGASITRVGQLCGEFVEVQELVELDPEWAADLIERSVDYCRAEGERRRTEPSQVAKEVFGLDSARAFALVAWCPVPNDNEAVG